MLANKLLSNKPKHLWKKWLSSSQFLERKRLNPPVKPCLSSQPTSHCNCDMWLVKYFEPIFPFGGWHHRHVLTCHDDDDDDDDVMVIS